MSEILAKDMSVMDVLNATHNNSPSSIIVFARSKYDGKTQTPVMLSLSESENLIKKLLNFMSLNGDYKALTILNTYYG